MLKCLRFATAICFMMLGCGYRDPDPGSETEAVDSSISDLTFTPNLANYASLLCSTPQANAPGSTFSAGMLNATHPRSRAALGGTGVGWAHDVAKTDVEFEVTALSTDIVHGSAQRVCAELAARSACNAYYACWYGDGTSTVEVNGDADCAPQDVDASVVVGTGPALPALQVGTSYRILARLHKGEPGGGYVAAEFWQGTTAVGSVTMATAVDRSPVNTGFSAYRADRVGVKVRLGGAQPFTNPAQSGTMIYGQANVVEGSLFATGEIWACGYDLRSFGNPEAASGSLCFTDIRNFHTDVGLEQPEASNWFRIDSPQSKAVLAGTGVDASGTIAATNLEFQITGASSTFDNASYGPRQQVCAEIGVLNPCNLTTVCWHADGNWKVERKRNPTLDSLAECGTHGVSTLASSTSSTKLPVLLAGAAGPTYGIKVASQLGDGAAALNVDFLRDGVLLRSHSIAQYAHYPEGGMSGLRNDRLTLRARLWGQADPCPDLGPCALDSATLIEGSRVEVERSGLACRYYNDFVPGFRALPTVGALQPPLSLTSSSYPTTTGGSCRPSVNLQYSVPPDAVKVHVYEDGYLIAVKNEQDPNAVPGLFNDPNGVLPGTEYTYQIVWENAAGELSQLKSTRVTAVSGCTPSRTLDGDYDTAVVLFYFPDRPPQYRKTVQEVRNVLFGTTQEGFTKSAAIAVEQMSRGSVQLLGHQIIDWVPLQGTYASQCLDAAGAPKRCAFSPPLDTQAAAALGGAGQYDFVMRFVDGLTTANMTGGYTSAYLPSAVLHDAMTQGDYHLIQHEFLGHGLGQLDHAGGYDCGGTIALGADFTDTSSMRSLEFGNRTCAAAPYGDTLDPMGAGYGYFGTMKLASMGWITANEVSSDNFGGSYLLGAIHGVGSTSFPKKQIRVNLQDNWFYFLEYHTGEGMEPIQNAGLQVRLWQTSPNFGDGQLLTNDPLQVGESYCDPERQVLISFEEELQGGASVKVQRQSCALPEPIPNHCPTLSAQLILTSGPLTLATVSASDTDADPLTYLTSAFLADGVTPVSGVTAANTIMPVYTCSAAGERVIRVSVSDGQCEASRNLLFTCVL